MPKTKTQESQSEFHTLYADHETFAVTPTALLHISARQYADRESLNHDLGYDSRIPPPIDDDVVLSWTPYWSLVRRETRDVPTAVGYFRHPERRYFGKAATNGGGAGVTHADAILHAALELVERDDDTPPGIRRDAAADVQRVVERFAATGHDLLVLDTSRLGIDVVTVRACAPGLRHWFPRFAAGRLYDVPVALGWIDKRLAEDELN